MLQYMVTETNRNAQHVLMQHHHSRSSRISQWTDTNLSEMKKFFGILIWMGLVKQPSIECYWSKDKKYKNEIVSCMVRNRFELILRFWHFSNNLEAPQNDKIHKIRQLVNRLVSKYQEIMTPGQQVAVDESMVPFRGRLGIKQYIPNKRHKYGVKLFKMCDKTGYTYSLSVYEGKHDRGNYSLASNTVLQLCNNYLDSGRVITTDNFYTSLPLANELLHRKTNLIGTVRTNRKGLPKEVISAKLKRSEIVGRENENGIIVAKWKDKRDVLMLSTYHDLSSVEIRKKYPPGKIVEKPKMIAAYNDGKAGIDLSDQLSSYCSPMRKSIRWYHKVAMELIFGTTVVNALIVYKIVSENKNMSIIKFREELVNSLLNINPCPDDSTEVNSTTTPKRKHILKETEEKCARNRKIRKRCTLCYKTLAKSVGSKEAAKQVKKITTYCAACKHNPYMCLKCY